MKRTLKRLFSLFALIFCITFLSSCFVESCVLRNCGVGYKDNKINHFSKLSSSVKRNDKYYYLDISLISEEDFNSANGKNVVKDVVLKENNYFNIDMYYYDEQNNKINCDFYNLYDERPNKVYPAEYIDDNDNLIIPHGMYYEIRFDNTGFVFAPLPNISSGKYFTATNNVRYYMNITSISEEQFSNSNGKNTVQTEYNTQIYYFSIEFYSLDGDGNKITYDFFNLQNVQPKTNAWISYKDDNGNVISLFYINDVNIYIKYTMTYNNNYYEFNY